LNESLLFIRRQITSGLSRGFTNPNRNGSCSKPSPIYFFTVQPTEIIDGELPCSQTLHCFFLNRRRAALSGGKVITIHDDSELMRLASSRSVRLVLTLERSEQMPKYLIQGSYSQQGLKGMLKEGGSKRREAAEQLIKGTGGRLEAYYYAFGSDDFVIIADLPSNVDAAALSFAVNASGAVQSRMTVLITPEEADQATKKMKTVKYRAPGE
jgi:uncharacterized protein with GYD domain